MKCGETIRWLLAAVFCCAATPARAAPVVVLIEQASSLYQQAAEGFRQEYPDSQLIQLNGDPRELEARLEVLRKAPPPMIVAIGMGARLARAARERLPGVPILYCLALEPVQNGLISSDIGGVALEVALPEQLAAIQNALPQVRRIGVIYNRPASGSLIDQARKHLKPGVSLVEADAPTPQRAAAVMEDVLGRVDAFWLLWDRVIADPANFRRLVELCLKNRVALIAPATTFVEAGALLSVGANYRAAGKRAGEMARLVVERKARAGEFRAEAPRETVLTINLQVAGRLGITFPRTLRAEFLSPP
jgi:ABC-type uncharacterized transport system substrate-binding protein